MKPINECKTVAELLEDPSRWTKNKAWGDGENGYALDRTEAKCFCVIGAIGFIYGDKYGCVVSESYRNKIEALIKGNICKWNDAPERTHAEVLEAVRKAGI